jgi:hypothetical protein
MGNETPPLLRTCIFNPISHLTRGLGPRVRRRLACIYGTVVYANHPLDENEKKQNLADHLVAFRRAKMTSNHLAVSLD